MFGWVDSVQIHDFPLPFAMLSFLKVLFDYWSCQHQRNLIFLVYENKILISRKQVNPRYASFDFF